MGGTNDKVTDFVAEARRLIIEGFNKWMESEEFTERLGEISQGMLGRLGVVFNDVDILVLTDFITGPPVFLEEGEEVEREDKKPKLSLNFKFGESDEDKEIGKMLGLGDEEMNRLIKLARRGKIKEGGAPSAGEEAPSRLCL